MSPNTASVRATVRPELLRWARERVGWDIEEASHRFPRLGAWEAGSKNPTFRQLETYAKATHTPIGYFFLAEPPRERVPIPDLRTVADRPLDEPSPDLLDTIYICQRRQEWYRDYAISQSEQPLPFVASVTIGNNIAATAADIRQALSFDVEERRQAATWTEALRRFIEQADAIGVLVMVNGVVGNNNYRKLDPDEFRGFALNDAFAPLIFINGADSKPAQMFTIAHELAHIWLGESALSDINPTAPSANVIERWCNEVAAELLVPNEVIRELYRKNEDLTQALDRLARHFKVSTLVVLRRLLDIGGLTRATFNQAYDEELKRIRDVTRASGGNFYLTQGARLGKRFARALIASTLEGQTLYRDAFNLLGFSKTSTFQDLARSLGVS
jgi:Zn-dependent peptidase ImmA (M78 family)/transcriptional regulator with XRE-family HTH domain